MTGDVGILEKLAATMIDFDPRFEIVRTKKDRGPAVANADPYEAVPRPAIAE